MSDQISQRISTATNYGSIEKLTASNYHSWKRSITLFLRSQKLLDIVEGTRPPLSANSSKDRQEKLETQEAKAALIIHETCSSEIQSFIFDTDDPHKMWIILDKEFNSASSALGREALVHQLATAKLEKDEQITNFISRMKGLRDRLRASPDEVNDASFKRYLLRALPTAYNTLKEIIIDQPELSLQQVITKITNSAVAEGLVSSSNSSSVSGTALIATGRNARFSNYRGGNSSRGNGRGKRSNISNPLIQAALTRNQASPNKSPLDCWECGELGHGRSNCPLQGKEKSSEQLRRGLEAFQRYQARRNDFEHKYPSPY